MHRYFSLSGVNADIRSEKPDEIKLKITAADFGGLMIGDSLSISGKITNGSSGAQCDLYISMKDIVPESLGLGKVKDTASVYGHATGPLAGPVIDGRIEFCSLIYLRCVFIKSTAIFGTRTVRLISAMLQAAFTAAMWKQQALTTLIPALIRLTH